MSLADALHDGATLTDLSREAAVVFEAYGVPNARVVWLNVRYCLSSGLDVRDGGVRHELVQWILATFGCAVPYPPGSRPDDSERSVTLQADRYGSTIGSPHGGSGRSGLSGRFNAKGIGRTPLVGESTDWYHSHGCMWLEEAVREAIAAESLHLDLGVDVTPILAIIDLGIRIAWGDGTFGRRRAVIVRPNKVRLAHLQRSVFFGSSGTPNSDQFRDAVRAREAINAAFSPTSDRQALCIRARTVLESFLALCEFLAIARFHRLWLGPYYPSNFSIDGAPIDYGSFRALANYRRFYSEEDKLPFGQEEHAVIAAYAGLAPYFSRNGVSCPSLGRMQLGAESRIRRTFAREARDAINLQTMASRNEDEIVDLLVAMYAAEQQEEARPDQHQESLSEHLGKSTSEPVRDELLRQFAGEICGKLRQCYGSSPAGVIGSIVSLHSMMRIWSQRPRLVRENLLRRSTRIAEGRLSLDHHLRDYIASTVGRSRRVWKDLPSAWIVLGQQTNLYSSSALCLEPSTSRVFFWVEMCRLQNCCVFGDDSVRTQEVCDADASSDKNWVRLGLPLGRWERAEPRSWPRQVVIGNRIFRVPSADMWYPEQWMSALFRSV